MSDSRAPGGISIVIPNWNGRALLEKFLTTVAAAAQAFEGASGRPTEILIADDASTDNSASWLSSHWPKVRFLGSSQRMGFAPTANRGIKAAVLPLVYLVNNDVALESSTLPPLADHFRDPNVFAVTGNAYDFATGVLRGAGQRGRFRHGFIAVHDRFFVPAGKENRTPLLTLFATGGSSLFDREKFLAIGGFDEMLAPFGWEDVELSLRAWKVGYEIRYEPRSVIWHQFSSTIEPRFRRRKVAATYERNRLLAHWIHLDTAGEALSHSITLFLKLLVSPFADRFELWRAFAQAAARLDQVRERRRNLRPRLKRTLQEIFERIDAQLSSPDVSKLDSVTAPARACAENAPGSGGASGLEADTRVLKRESNCRKDGPIENG